ncbi:MAG: SDR family NAD(P)-dependent oxidoreductase [Dehalococcoidia bacterium]
MERPFSGQWSLVLGASSGFGAAIVRELARQGSNIFGVHLDRRQTMAGVEELIASLKADGVEAEYFNINAADEAKRVEAVGAMRARTQVPLRVIVHSIAFGTTGLGFIPGPDGAKLNQKQVEMSSIRWATAWCTGCRTCSKLDWRGRAPASTA